MYKTILFDLGGVIVPLDFASGYHAISMHCPYQPEEIPGRIRETGIVPLFEKGLMGETEFIDRLSRHLRLHVTESQFRALWGSIFPSYTLLPASLLEGLKRTYRLVLLSNTNSIHFRTIRENYPLLGHFDDFVLSYEVGEMKPSARIYEEAILRSKCSPEHCFFTDDVRANVDAARAAGIDSVAFQSHQQLLDAFDERGILWRG
jgi:putative hydrolase of the HAD superfamily